MAGFGHLGSVPLVEHVPTGFFFFFFFSFLGRSAIGRACVAGVKEMWMLERRGNLQPRP